MNVEQKIDEKAMFTAIEDSFAMILFDPYGKILWANDKFTNVLGYDVTELVQMHHRQLCLPEFVNSNGYKEFWDHLRAGKPFHDKVQRMRKDKHILWLEAFYTPVFDENKQVQSVVKIAMDITDRQNLLENSTNEFIAVVEEMTAATNEVHQASESIVESISVLNKQSEIVKMDVENIQSVISYVKEISTQSNLLGLNASIEAARAGSSGRGFAIVANEIRKMADKSKDSANDISKQLEEIITSVNVMMEMIKKVTEKIDNNSESIEELKKAYEHIANTAENLATII
ncbi:PAS domain-containing protein [Bacillus ginsengihumi]|uniref:Histidine kinase n=1 Tax=Heyndrickxia ginsengihumi TaxID=363870 RepID=A0A0A6V7W2_9BACI|nr:methyl-accepting chemotaxis protein [Heyndrickxia ginsengihumi]KHD84145.1 histidine kinase [Heyndrickxia ginsengihumi]MCM3024708.1 methyl-accepting chemotaxis protein [Heyndrickxia ginsengihumi]NEY19782.1 PAS domain-containing protein [Heyndrickxia ginsengihumi]